MKICSLLTAMGLVVCSPLMPMGWAQQPAPGGRPKLELRGPEPAAAPVKAVAKPAPIPVSLTIPAGAPLYVALTKTVPVHQAGEAVTGRLLRPVYVFDRQVLPAGTKVYGKISWVQGISVPVRALALANGNLTPYRKVHVAFTSVKLPDGRRMAVKTTVSAGVPRMMKLVAGGNAKAKQKTGERARLHQEASGRIAQAKRTVDASVHQTLAEVKAPGKWKRLKGRVKASMVAALPWHNEKLPAGMQYTAILNAPLSMGQMTVQTSELAQVGKKIPAGSVVRAWLETPLSSATSHFGTPVKAVISRPVYTAKGHRLVLPEGAVILGQVTRAVPAKRFGRNGQLRLMFREIRLPSGLKEQIAGSLYSVAASSGTHVRLDSEGGAHVAQSKTRFIMPAIDVLLATSSTDGLEHHHDPLDAGLRRGPDYAGGAVRGGASLGFLGMVLGIAAHSRVLSSGLAFYGAGRSVYSHFLADGQNIVFARDTPMQIRFAPAQGKELKLPGPAAGSGGMASGRS